MSVTISIQHLNRDLALRINNEARRDPKSPFAGKFVGLASGKVVVISEDLDELAARLRQIEPDPAKTFVIEASRDYGEVHEVWELR